MNEPAAPEPSPSLTAGALLRQARQARGLHLMALSAALKVPASRLEAMEEDRWHDLFDAAYARALAHTMSRALGIDPQPVLAGLPAAPGLRVDALGTGLDQPFRDTPSLGGGRSVRRRAGVVGLGLLLAVAVWWWLDSGHAVWVPAAGAPAGTVRTVPQAPPGSATERVAPTASAAGRGASEADAPAATPRSGASAVRIVAAEPSWIELRDAQGQIRLARLLGAGEALELPLEPGLGLTVGNAAATRVWVNGQAIDLGGMTRENVARFELR
jgi:cytoskeleton protein RodZ